MAHGDVKHKRQRSSYRSTPINWDAKDRQASYEKYLRITEHGSVWSYMQGMSGDALIDAKQAMTTIKRRGEYDWRKVMSKLTEAQRSEINKRIQGRQDEIDAEVKDRTEKRRAQLVAKSAEQSAEFHKNADLTAGMLRSDVHQAVTYRDRYGLDDGDWLDNPVAAYSGRGWAAEERIVGAAGVKLQVTLSLDVSNSMWHNGIAQDAIRTFIELGLALNRLAEENEGSVFARSFLFAMHDDGKHSECLQGNAWGYHLPEEMRIGEFEMLRKHVKSTFVPHFAGDDTYISPLFFAIQTWEMEHSDPGAVRLDLVITDGVLEHPRDITSASRLQEQRDGSLQTVLLNFLPEEEWKDGKLPIRCTQYHIDKDNVGGTLRNLISEFVSVYV